MKTYLYAILAAFVLGTLTGNAVYAGDHMMGQRLDVRNYPAQIPVIGHFAVHTYPEAFDNDNNRHAWGALGNHEGGNVLDDTTVECTSGKNCIDISTLNYVMSEAPCIWPVKPYYAVVGICWNATNRALYFIRKTVHNVKYYNIAEWWFGTYGLDEGSTCLTNTCKQGREQYNWTKCFNAVNKNYPWQGRTEQIMSAMNPRINLYNKYYGPTAGSFRDENTWVRYLQELVNLQMNEKLPGISSDKKNRILGIHKNMLQRKNQPGLTAESYDQYRKGLEAMFNDVLDECRKVFTDEEYRKFFGAEKSEKFALPLEMAFR